MLSIRPDHLHSPECARYLEETLRVWTGAPPDARGVLEPIPWALAKRLLRVEEQDSGRRDQWGCWEYGFSESFRAGRLLIPDIDDWVRGQRERLSTTYRLLPLWPDDRPFAVCLTHDVDMLSRQVTPRQAWRALRTSIRDLRSSGATRSSTEGLLRSIARPFYFGVRRMPSCGETLDRCLTIEEEEDVRSSYLFSLPAHNSTTPYDCLYALDDRCRLRGRPRTISAVIEEIGASGHDVGLHGSYRSALDQEMLRAERVALEDCLGRAVRATRQHFLHWQVSVTPVIQEQAGLQLDSTLGFNRAVGFRAGTALPFRLFDTASRRTLDLLEVPLIVQDAPLLSSTGLELDEHQATVLMEQLFTTVCHGGGVLTLLYHPHTFLEHQAAEVYRWSIRRAKAMGAWIATLGEINDWWRARERELCATWATSDPP